MRSLMRVSVLMGAPFLVDHPATRRLPSPRAREPRKTGRRDAGDKPSLEAPRITDLGRPDPDDPRAEGVGGGPPLAGRPPLVYQ
jgi:hypothetical protein